MFKKKNVVESKSIFKVFIPEVYEGPSEHIFGYFDSRELAEECLKESLEYISEQDKRSVFFELRRKIVYNQACFEITGKSPDEFYDLSKTCSDAYINIYEKIDVRNDELWFEQFGKLSEDEFEEKFNQIYSYEILPDNEPKIEEIKIYSRNG